MFRHRRSRGLWIAIVAALAIGTTLAAGAGATVHRQHATPVVFGVGADPAFAPWIVGVEKGFFDKYGVDAQLKYFGGGALANDAMVAGEIQFSGSGAGTVLPRIATKKIATIARTATSGTTFSIVAKKDMTSPSDFVGKKLATVQGTTMEYVWGLFLKKNKIPADKVDMVYASPPELTTSLVQGRIDAMLMFQPWPLKATQLSSNVRIFQYSRQIGYLLQFHATGNSDWMRSHPGATVGVLRGLRDAIAYINSNRSDAVAIMAGVMHQPVSDTASQVNDYTYRLAMPDRPMILNMHHEATWLAQKHKLNTRVFPWKTAFQTQYLAKVLNVKPVSAVLAKKKQQ